MEEPLPAGGSCLLGSINLSEFVLDPFTPNARVDYEALEKAVVISIQGLNQVLLEGMDLHPLEIQRKSVYDWRQIGLGTLGLGDMLIKMSIKYGSHESLKIIDSVFKLIATTAVETSLQLAKLEGCYPMCNKEALVKSEFIEALNLPFNVIEDIKKFGLFNSQLLTCAPTGSIGTMLQVSTGVEPNFAFSFNRRTVSLNSEETIYTVDADIVRQYKAKCGDVDTLPDFFIASHDIDWLDRLAVQETLQYWIDASISSTINLPEETTVEEIAEIYIEAWKRNLKGVTIWRDNCQRQGILSTKKEEKIEETQAEPIHRPERGEIIKAGDNCIGLKRTLMTGCGTLHCEAFFDPNTGELRETYLSKGSTGGCNNFMISLSRMISLAARGGIGIDKILDQLKSCGVCPSYAVRSATKGDTSKGSCCPVAVGNALRDMHKEIQEIICECNEYKPNPDIFPGGQKALDTLKEKGIYLKKIDGGFTPEYIALEDIPKKESQSSAEAVKEYFQNNSLEECPNCHEKTLIHQGGCIQCNSCGYSKCS